MMEGILHIAVIPYETGETHFKYSRKLSSDGTQYIRDGLFEEFYPNGALSSSGMYQDGLEEGLWKDYHENGSLAAEGYYHKGKRLAFGNITMKMVVLKAKKIMENR